MQPRGEANGDIEALVFEFLERFEAEGDAALEALAREHPQRAAELERRVGALRAAGLLGPDPAAPEFPEQLGEFRILSRLGGGGMGVVYLARQESLGRDVALKLVRPDQLYVPGSRERFRREVALAARLQHPSIVPVYAVGEERGVPFFAMERVDGAALADVLRALEGRAPRSLSGRDLFDALAACGAGNDGAPAGAPPPELFDGGWTSVCLRIARAAALALEHAHGRGVLHRDVKAGNLLVTRAGRVLLSDFGLATGQGSTRLTRTGSELGSLPYIAPERLRGEPGDARSDVYGLGIVLFELLALRSPYLEGSDESTRARVLEGEPPPLRRLNPAVPLEVETVCLAAMDPEPARRYPSAGAFTRDLDNALARRPIEARRAGPGRRAWRLAQRHPAWSVGLALGSLALLVGPSVYAVQQHFAGERIRAVNQELGRSLASEREALAAARRETERAERSFESALEAVDRMLTRVGDEELDLVPHMEQIRRDVLEDALALFLALAEERSSDPALALELAAAECRLGAIQAHLGRYAESEAVYRSAADRIRPLGTGPEDDPEQRFELAQALTGLAHSLRKLDSLGEAEAAFRESEVLCEQLCRESCPFDVRLHLVRVRGGRALVLHVLGRSEEALGELLAALGLAHELAAENPASREVELLLPDLAATRGVVAYESRELALAADAFEEATAAFERLLALRPHDVALRADAADCATNFSAALVGRGEHGRAEELSRRALALRESLLSDFPTVPEYANAAANLRLNLAAALQFSPGARAEMRALLEAAQRDSARATEAVPANAEYRFLDGAIASALGAVLVDAEEPERARESFERARAEIGAAIAAMPARAIYSDVLGEALMGLTDAELALSRPAEAAQALRDALAAHRPDWVFHRRAADKLARAAEIAAAAEGPGESAEALAAEVVALMARSIELGYRDLEDLRGSPAFAHLRQRADFQALLEELEALMQ